MRPNRYPYTKNQWEEENYCCYINIYGKRIVLKILKNKVTGETKQCH